MFILNFYYQLIEGVHCDIVYSLELTLKIDKNSRKERERKMCSLRKCIFEINSNDRTIRFIWDFNSLKKSKFHFFLRLVYEIGKWSAVMC